jgi:hypothetical protein
VNAGSGRERLGIGPSGKCPILEANTALRRTAAANESVPLGVHHRFFAETGIKESDWRGKFWVRWSDAVKEAGFQPNELTAARTSEDLLNHLAALVQELGRFPVMAEVRIKARSDPKFPSDKTFRRLGGKRALAARLEKFCRDRGENRRASTPFKRDATLADFAPDMGGRKQRQMPNVRSGDHCFVTGTNESPGLRGEDHVGVQRGVVG